jgi:hypothetical protein
MKGEDSKEGCPKEVQGTSHEGMSRHPLPLAGHQGIERTVEKVNSRYYWRGISKDESAYVKGRMECNQNKKATVTARHPMFSYHVGAPMERVHLDFIGPLPRTEQAYFNDGRSIYKVGRVHPFAFSECRGDDKSRCASVLFQVWVSIPSIY